MAHEHPNVPDAYDRFPQRPNHARVVAREGRFSQGSEFNEAQSIGAARARRIGNLTARDGDRVTGAEILVNVGGGSVILAAGEIYVKGDVRPVPARTITGVTWTGDKIVGVRLRSVVVTEEDDPSLYNLHPDPETEGEPGAAREIDTLTWSIKGDATPGDFYQVYLVRNGTVIDQAPPPALGGINAAIAEYDRDALGSYIVKGCRVTALGLSAGKQVFSIDAGVANINGFKRTRFTALRHEELQVYETETVDAEPHTFADGGSGSATIRVNRGPIDVINSVVITKQVTETIVRGTPNNTMDALGHSGAVSIVSVVQGATTFVAGTDYLLTADKVDWTPLGAEPAGGSSYDVTYRYLDAVTPTSVTYDTFVVTGGVTGTTVIVGYDWRLPRIDLLCLDQDGLTVYLRGAPARFRPVPPIAPVSLLPLAQVSNDWRGIPGIKNSGTRSIPVEEQWRYFNHLFDMTILFSEERLKRNLDSREPVAKRGVFVDPFTSDRWRDAGEPQDAAVVFGSLQIAIDPTFHPVEMDGPLMLEWTDEVIISQRLKTGCLQINPYQAFDPLPGRLSLTPAQDFWVTHQVEWTSPTTQTIAGTSNRTTVEDVLVDQREELLEFLREITVSFTIKGFGAGETLASLTFDSLSVTPAGPLVADGAGEIDGSFDIPPNVVAGQKAVVATGGGGSTARATFVGQGKVDIDIMQRVTLIEVAPGRGVDPLAQTWALPQARHVVGVNLWPCAIGDENNAIVVDLVNVETGLPTTDVIASAFQPMDAAVVDELLPVRFRAPVFTPADREFAHVVKSDDADHALSIATLGEFDPDEQQWVAAQPYAVGVLLSSSNASTWSPHQGSDMTFEVVAAKFSPTSRTVVLGTFDLVDCSDLLVLATVELPTAECAFRFEVVRADASVIRLAPNQVWEFTEFVTETVTLRAVLTGTQFVSPTLWPGVTLVSGKMRATGTYVSRAFEVASAIRLFTVVDAILPAGSTASFAIDAADDVWTTIPFDAATPLNDGWVERQYQLDPYTAPLEARLKITLTGTPAARPSLSNLRAAAI